MASLRPTTISRDVVEKYQKAAENIVFSLPDLSRDEQIVWLIWLIDPTQSSDDEITLEVAGQAIDAARKTY
jgi:hypothetical protein